MTSGATGGAGDTGATGDTGPADGERGPSGSTTITHSTTTTTLPPDARTTTTVPSPGAITSTTASLSSTSKTTTHAGRTAPYDITTTPTPSPPPPCHGPRGVQFTLIFSDNQLYRVRRKTTVFIIGYIMAHKTKKRISMMFLHIYAQTHLVFFSNSKFNSMQFTTSVPRSTPEILKRLKFKNWLT